MVGAFTKACPHCDQSIPGWHSRLFGKDVTIDRIPAADPPHVKVTWGPFPCTSCSAKLVLTCADARLMHKLAVAFFGSIVAGFVLGYFIGWGGCFTCDMLLVGLLVALSVSWTVARSIEVGVVKTGFAFVGDTPPHGPA